MKIKTDHEWHQKRDSHCGTSVSWYECEHCEAIKGAPNEPSTCPGKSIWLGIRRRSLETDRDFNRKMVESYQLRLIEIDKELSALEKQINGTTD